MTWTQSLNLLCLSPESEIRARLQSASPPARCENFTQEKRSDKPNQSRFFTVLVTFQGRSWMTWSACWGETAPPAPAPVRPSPPTTPCPSPGRPAWKPGLHPRAPQVQPVRCSEPIRRFFSTSWFKRFGSVSDPYGSVWHGDVGSGYGYNTNPNNYSTTSTLYQSGQNQPGTRTPDCFQTLQIHKHLIFIQIEFWKLNVDLQDWILVIPSFLSSQIKIFNSCSSSKTVQPGYLWLLPVLVWSSDAPVHAAWLTPWH